ncbi:MAG: efflux RND transporter periplasmic adaptor subunit [Gammaproteobacteria bacterium]|nr:efflux RND transporter periplasmic adaptor subunit [Gammaproteobacteria bacterium]
MTLSNFKPFMVGCAIIAGAVVVVMGLGAAKPEAEREEKEKPPMVVRTAEAELKEQTVFATFQGEVRAKTNIELVTQVTGKVTAVSDKFVEGGEFKAGETLLQIDDSDYQVALRSAEASVASAQVDLEMEEATAANRAREWVDLQGKSIEEANPLVLNKPQIDRAKARLAAARAELSAAKLNYDRTKISAPFDGRIMTKSAELGQFMARGASVGRVFAVEAMEVRIPMTDVQISELGLRLGYSADDKTATGIPATVSAVFGDSRRNWQGYVKSVDASVDAQTRLLFATIVVDQPFDENNASSVPLIPGLFVDVEIASPERIVGLELPRTALRNGNQVYAYHQDVLRLKPVRVIYTSQDKVIIAQDSSEISVGERIITSSVPGAHDGMSVKLTKDQESEKIANSVPNKLQIDESVEGPQESQDVAQPSIDESNNDKELDSEKTDTGMSEAESSNALIAQSS